MRLDWGRSSEATAVEAVQHELQRPGPRQRERILQQLRGRALDGCERRQHVQGLAEGLHPAGRKAASLPP